MEQVLFPYISQFTVKSNDAQPAYQYKYKEYPHLSLGGILDKIVWVAAQHISIIRFQYK